MKMYGVAVESLASMEEIAVERIFCQEWAQGEQVEACKWLICIDICGGNTVWQKGHSGR